MSVLRLHNIRVNAGATTLLDIDEIEVFNGEVLVVLGATGAGKSTLLRVMNTLQKPNQGELFWQGNRLPSPAPLAIRRQMAMAFQDPLLFSGSVFENVAFGLRLRGEKKSELEAKVTQVLRLFHIESLAHRSVKSLSGGEAQRTALARAVVLRPKLLLLDEPLASLDASTRETLRSELLRIIRRLALSCVFVTHDQHEAAVLADRVAILDKGKTLQVGTVEDLFCRPVNRRVAQFVRIGNILPSRVVARDGELAVVDLAGWRLGIRGDLPVGATATLFVRPDHIDITKANGQAQELGWNRIWGTVTAVEEDGMNRKIAVDCGILLYVNVRRTAVFTVGDAVELHLSQDAIHMIDRIDSEDSC